MEGTYTTSDIEVIKEFERLLSTSAVTAHVASNYWHVVQRHYAEPWRTVGAPSHAYFQWLAAQFNDTKSPAAVHGVVLPYRKA